MNPLLIKKIAELENKFWMAQSKEEKQKYSDMMQAICRNHGIEFNPSNEEYPFMKNGQAYPSIEAINETKRIKITKEILMESK